MSRPLPAALQEWERQLRAAGVPSPAQDARALAATVLSAEPIAVALRPDLSDADRARIDELVRRRAKREPLQHIVGTAPFLDLELIVGPGVFVPRPETEVLAVWAIDWLATCGDAPIAVDLCSGSGALAFALATRVPGARVTGVELSAAALSYAERNLQRYLDRLGTAELEFRAGDATDPQLLPMLSSNVDLVVCNPPYIPNEAIPRDPEVRDYDPELALYGGPDGLAVVRKMLPVVRRLLRPGGRLAMEHGDLQGDDHGLPGLIKAAGGFTDVVDYPDLAGRPRFTTAVLAD
ncbi:MAG: peptide chain release factor N(5)-glutamine methyltransferase [Actinomycetia bacterium]|nr:peptide chain release factor N(5)-glutamine methyltransferase [Actinomycetes bacterium]MCH9800802.1 peptide chain release factor N(5)-glutamine methyltransferase [Actinomycetes bacterium]